MPTTNTGIGVAAFAGAAQAPVEEPGFSQEHYRDQPSGGSDEDDCAPTQGVAAAPRPRAAAVAAAEEDFAEDGWRDNEEAGEDDDGQPEKCAAVCAQKRSRS